jgi:hypothetical protein
MSVAAAEFRAALGACGITQHHAARLFGVTLRSIRRWQDGSRRTPYGVAIVCRLLAIKMVTVAQVERAAVPVLAPTKNASAKPEPRAPLRVEPAPEQSALACARTATLADPGPTTAEKVCALTLTGCRWPFGDPRHPDFRFCGNSVVAPPYCERHRVMAYLAPRTGSGHGVRVGFVAHGRQPRPQQVPAHGSPSTPSAFSATGTARLPISRAAFPGSAPPPA